MERTSITAAASLASLGALLASPGGANADVIYQRDFESGSTYNEWNVNLFASTPGFSRFLGRFGNRTARLTLNMPELAQAQPGEPVFGSHNGQGAGSPGTPGEALLLEFDFYVIDSWDGSDAEYGQDRFSVSVNGIMLLSDTFANQHLNRTAGDPMVGPTQLGFNGNYMDSIYRFAFVLPDMPDAEQLVIDFKADGLYPNANDESWGLDNIRISRIPQLPAPGASAMALLGVGAMARRRRR